MLIHNWMDKISWRSLFTRSHAAILTLQWRCDGHDLAITIRLFKEKIDEIVEKDEEYMMSESDASDKSKTFKSLVKA